jgi:hypothetical protein
MQDAAAGCALPTCKVQQRSHLLPCSALPHAAHLWLSTCGVQAAEHSMPMATGW